MKRLALGDPLPIQDGFEKWASDALREIERATVDDVQAVLAEFSVTGTVTEIRTFDVDTGTLDDLRNFLATMISDIQKGGQKRSYGS